MTYCIKFLRLCIVAVLSSRMASVESVAIKDDPRKLFGGYRITPRFCKPTRTPKESQGPNICMFNHECIQRKGELVGACMDGFLFGACCHLPVEYAGEFLGSAANGNIIETESSRPLYVYSTTSIKPIITSLKTRMPVVTTTDHKSNVGNDVIITAEDNDIVQITNSNTQFTASGVSHTPPDTDILSQEDNNISPEDFKKPPNVTKRPTMEDRKTTHRSEDTTLPYSSDSPIIHISISNGPTPSSSYPVTFHPYKPPQSEQDKYVLVPTITHSARPQDIIQTTNEQTTSVINLYQYLVNESSTNNPYYGYYTFPNNNKKPGVVEKIQTTTKKPLSTSYVFSTTIPPRRTTKPTTYKRPTTNKKQTTKKPPSTSYVYSTKIPPRRTTVTTTKKRPQTTKKPQKTKKPTKNPNDNRKPTARPTTTTPYIYPPSTFRPGHSTFAATPDAFYSGSTGPSSSTSYYQYNQSPSRPQSASTVSTHIAGPGFSVSSNPSISSPAPTLIVLGPYNDQEPSASSINNAGERPSLSSYQSTTPPYQFSRPSSPNRKPINHVVVNNHVTQNIYSTTQRPSSSTSSEVLITPKPPGYIQTDDYSALASNTQPTIYDGVNIGNIDSDLVNFPPVRNPNLNLTAVQLNVDDVTTPVFIEDQALEQNVEAFVNKIIQGLQEPFHGLRDIVVHNKTKTSALSTTSTAKPIKKQGSTTKRPSSSRPSSSVTRPGSQSGTASSRPTRKPSTRKPSSSSLSTRKPTQVTTKKTKTSKPQKVTSTTQSFIEVDTQSASDAEQYRNQCGVRPLVKTGRVVGGKDSRFGEFPWQVLVRESTWLGLFTKNKCGGVLISSRYVMTAAHCQPGFLASLVAVFGEFDISGELEKKRSLTRNVKRVIVHRQYDAATFENDLALLELEHPVLFDTHIVPICLPDEKADFTGRMATVTGWGRLKYGGGIPNVLQEVQVPIMENHVCQEMFRTAGHHKIILNSFLCAGYANGQKDSCEGDSGGPLVLQRPDGRYQLAGTVSHGIKCAAPYLPGVYMRTTYYKPWITSITGVK